MDIHDNNFYINNFDPQNKKTREEDKETSEEENKKTQNDISSSTPIDKFLNFKYSELFSFVSILSFIFIALSYILNYTYAVNASNFYNIPSQYFIYTDFKELTFKLSVFLIYIILPFTLLFIGKRTSFLPMDKYKKTYCFFMLFILFPLVNFLFIVFYTKNICYVFTISLISSLLVVNLFRKINFYIISFLHIVLLFIIFNLMLPLGPKDRTAYEIIHSKDNNQIISVVLAKYNDKFLIADYPCDGNASFKKPKKYYFEQMQGQDLEYKIIEDINKTEVKPNKLCEKNNKKRRQQTSNFINRLLEIKSFCF